MGSPSRWYHVVVWSSQTNAQGLKLRYRTAQKVYGPDANGNRQSAAPTPAGAPPYCPGDRSLSYVMVSVTGQQIVYTGATAFRPGSGATAYMQFYGTPNRAVLERKPQVRPGPDTLCFLRGTQKIDEGTGGAAAYCRRFGKPSRCRFRWRQPYRYAQEIVDPNMPNHLQAE